MSDRITTTEALRLAREALEDQERFDALEAPWLESLKRPARERVGFEEATSQLEVVRDDRSLSARTREPLLARALVEMLGVDESYDASWMSDWLAVTARGEHCKVMEPILDPGGYVDARDLRALAAYMLRKADELDARAADGGGR